MQTSEEGNLTSLKGKEREQHIYQCINQRVLMNNTPFTNCCKRPIDKLIKNFGLVISVQFVLHCRYNGEVGDVVVGRITEVSKNLLCKRLTNSCIHVE